MSRSDQVTPLDRLAGRGPTLAVLLLGAGLGFVAAAQPWWRADGAGVTERTDTHVTALNTAALAAFSSSAPHRSKRRIPPGPDARAAAEVLRANNNPSAADDSAAAPVIDLAVYARAVESRRTLP